MCPTKFVNWGKIHHHQIFDEFDEYFHEYSGQRTKTYDALFSWWHYYTFRDRERHLWAFDFVGFFWFLVRNASRFFDQRCSSFFLDTMARSGMSVIEYYLWLVCNASWFRQPEMPAVFSSCNGARLGITRCARNWIPRGALFVLLGVIEWGFIGCWWITHLDFFNQRCSSFFWIKWHV